VCGIGLLGLGRGPLALPPGPDPEPPPPGVDDPPPPASEAPPVPQFPVVRSPGSHRPGSASARRRRSRRRARGSLSVVTGGIADLLLLGGANLRRLRDGPRAASRARTPRDPGRRVARHS